MTLSGGQTQRLFVALALINDPEVVFLDELTTGLDPQARRAIWDLVRDIRERGKTVFLTTHLMEEAERLCDRVAIMDHVRIIDIDSPAGLVGRHCPERTVFLSTADTAAAERFHTVAGVEAVDRDDTSYTIRGRGDDLVTALIRCPLRKQDHGDRLPHRHADARGRVPQAHRAFHPQLSRQDMLRGLLALTWLEIKIFLREPLGVVATVVVPVAIFLFLGEGLGDELSSDSPTGNWLMTVEIPIFASLLIALNAVVSIVAIILIYREGGILKRLRATPLRPQTILGAHVIVKLLLTTVTLGAMALAGRRLYPCLDRPPGAQLRSRTPVYDGDSSVDRLLDRQHHPDSSDGATCREHHSVSDGWILWPVRPPRPATHGDTSYRPPPFH